MASRFCISFLCLAFSYGAVISRWEDIPPTGIATNTEGNFIYGSENPQDFVLRNTGIFFVNPQATLKIKAQISGSWKAMEGDICGIVFCGTRQNINGQVIHKYTFNEGNLIFDLNTSDTFVTPDFGFFALDSAELNITSHLTIALAQQNFENTNLFSLRNASRLNIENANLSINTLSGFIGANNDSQITINQGGNRYRQHVAIRGNIALDGKSSLSLFLGNKSSYFEGDIALSGTSELRLSLFDSRAVFWNYRQAVGANASLELNHQSTLNALIQNGSGTNITLRDRSSWIMRGDSRIRNLEIHNSTVDFLQNHEKPKTLHAQSLSGNGIFALYADLQTRQTDSATFDQANGAHIVQMNYNRATFTQALAQGISEEDNMVVATIENLTSVATFDGGLTDMGLTSYKTNLVSRQQGGRTQWLISNIVPDRDSPLSRVLSTALNTPYRLFDTTNSTLDLRLGDLRNYPKDHGLYARYIVGVGNLQETKNTFQTQDIWMSFAGGYDINKVYKGHTDFLGLGFEISLMDSKNSAYTSSTQAYGANLYYTSIFNNRFYYDVIFKYAFSQHSFEFSNANNLSGKTSFDAHLITLGFEMGKKFGFGKSKNIFYMQPQGKITSGIIVPTSFEIQDIYGEKIQGKSQLQIPLITRASFYFGYEWNEEIKGDFKLGSFVEYSLNNGGDIVLKDSRSQLKKTFNGDLDVGISAVGSIQLENFLRFYMQIDSAFLGDYASNVAFNAGIRWSFGDRYVPPPPPPADPNRFNIRYKYDNRQRTIPVVQEDDVTNMKHHGTNKEAFERDYRRLQTSPKKFSPPLIEKNQSRPHPRDNYRPNQYLDTQKEYNRKSKRDSYIPSHSKVGNVGRIRETKDKK